MTGSCQQTAVMFATLALLLMRRETRDERRGDGVGWVAGWVRRAQSVDVGSREKGEGRALTGESRRATLEFVLDDAGSENFAGGGQIRSRDTSESQRFPSHNSHPGKAPFLPSASCTVARTFEHFSMLLKICTSSYLGIVLILAVMACMLYSVLPTCIHSRDLSSLFLVALEKEGS
jgi:hypothetical protein